MAGECLVISIIIAVMAIGFFRAHRKNWGLAVIPLGFVPFVLGAIMYCCDKIFHVEYTFILPMTIVIISLIITCIWIGFATAILIKTKKLRMMYVSVSVVFVFTVSIVMLIRYYSLLSM